jgi:hypothetical protein
VVSAPYSGPRQTRRVEALGRAKYILVEASKCPFLYIDSIGVDGMGWDLVGWRSGIPTGIGSSYLHTSHACIGAAFSRKQRD